MGDLGVQVKLHACMAALHGPTDLIEKMQKGHPAKMSSHDDIESIVTEHSKSAFEHGGWIAPPN